jgi:hypothetical protein
MTRAHDYDIVNGGIDGRSAVMPAPDWRLRRPFALFAKERENGIGRVQSRLIPQAHLIFPESNRFRIESNSFSGGWNGLSR